MSEVSSKRTLLDIDDDLMALDDLLAETGGDISDPQVAEAIDGIMAELESDFLSKADRIVAYVQELNLRSEARKKEADRLAKRAKQDKHTADFLKQNLLSVMQKHGRKRVDTDRFKVTVAGNGGKLPVDISEDVDVKMLPEKFQHVERRVDKDAVREALESGETLTFARLGERGQHLRIS